MWTEKKLDHDPYSQQEHNPKAYSTRAQQEAKQGGRKKKLLLQCLWSGKSQLINLEKLIQSLARKGREHFSQRTGNLHKKKPE